jgi:hypothetical protein
VLQSPATAELAGGVEEGGSGSRGAQTTTRPPRTSEVFRAAYASAAGAGASADPLPPAGPDALARHTRGSWISTLWARLSKGRLAPLVATPYDDDHGPEPSIPWFSFMLLVYATALTLALTWIFWTGRVHRQGEPAPPEVSRSSPDPVAKTSEPHAPAHTRPAIPAANIAQLGQTIRIGDLEVTAVSVVLASVELVRTIDPDADHRDEPDALIVTLRFRNVSPDQTFAPLEQAFVREPNAPLDRSLIETAYGARIGLFPLAYDSEWSIAGQDFPVLKPGESAQTMVASEPGVGSRVRDGGTWCIRLRIGPYRTDMLGIRFTGTDIGE